MDGHEFGQTPGYSEGQGSLVCCSPWDCEELDTTWQQNNNSKKVTVRTRSLLGCFQNGPLACHQRSDSAEGQTYSVETHSSRGTEVSQDSLESWMRKLDLEA